MGTAYVGINVPATLAVTFKENDPCEQNNTKLI